MAALMFIGDLYDYQLEGAERMLRRGIFLLAFRVGLGKRLDVETPVLTPGGWVRNGDLRVGDQVVGRDGRPTRVEGVYDHGVGSAYRVTMNDGTSVVADGDHLWTVQPASHGNGHGRERLWRTLTTKQILEKGVTRVQSRPGSGDSFKWFLPLVDPVQHPKRGLPVDPYLLGVLLANGSLSDNCVSFRTNDVEISQRVFDRCSDLSFGDATYERSTAKGWRIHKFHPVLQRLGIDCLHSREKFIPERYLTTCEEDRWLLLEGLMDCDGSVKRGRRAVYNSYSWRLAEGVATLVRSLGGVARVDRYDRSDGDTEYRTVIWMRESPFFLNRKSRDYVPKHPWFRAIASVEPVQTCEMRCIRVSAEDGLYVVNDYILTHNTPTTLAACEDLLECRRAHQVLIVCPASLKGQWAAAIANFTNHHALVVQGTPKQRAQQYERAYLGAAPYVIVNYEQVRDDWDFVKNLCRDAIVADEAGAIKGFKSKRSKAMGRLRGKVHWALTATPIENRLEELYAIMKWVDPRILGRWDIFDQTFIKRDFWGTPVRYINIPLLREILDPYWAVVTREDVADQLPERLEVEELIQLHPRARQIYEDISGDLVSAISEAQQVMGSSFNLWGHYHGQDERGSRAKGLVMSRFTALRQACLDPRLLQVSARKYERMRGEGSEYCHQLMISNRLFDAPSSKIDRLIEILKEEAGEKVVVFSSYVEAIKLVAERFDSVGITYVLFHGQMSHKLREECRKTFKTDSKIQVFLSSDAGGKGLDLPEADLHINLDLPWSGGLIEQRDGRIDRIISTYDRITILDLIAERTIEEWMADRLAVKRGASEAVMTGKSVGPEGKVRATADSLKSFLMRP